MHRAVLVEVAKRLPIQALKKFAQTNDMCNDAAREAWETWQVACTIMGAGRMFSDKCWMDTYTRTLRQHAYRYSDASKLWTVMHAIPLWLWTALQPLLHASLKPHMLSVRMKKDGSVLNLVCVRDAVVWATISSKGDYWRFTDIFPDLENRELVAKALNSVRILLARKDRATTEKKGGGGGGGGSAAAVHSRRLKHVRSRRVSLLASGGEARV